MKVLFENQQYRIRYLEEADLNNFKEFIRNEWSKDHIFTRSDLLFRWQHQNSDYYNFYVAELITTNEIIGILGFIPINLYSKDDNNDQFGAIWKVSDKAPLGVGMKLMNLILKNKNVKFFGAVGISNIAKDIYSVLNFKLGYLKHYYITNPAIKEFQILKIQNVDTICSTTNYQLSEIEDIEDVCIPHSYLPSKNKAYLINRYIEHPIYNYKLMGLYKLGILHCIFVIRKQRYNDKFCLRIVDVYGEFSPSSSIKILFQNLLKTEQAEYIDCLNYGIDERVFKLAGFQTLDLDSEIIVPNYFEPFVQKNIKIEFAVKTDYPNFVLFKGDSDQDRPNQL